MPEKLEHPSSSTVDEVYNLIGHLGYGQLLCFLILGSLHIFTALHMVQIIFIG